MRILVTGSRGFVGSETVELLTGSRRFVGSETVELLECGDSVEYFDIMDGRDIRDLGTLDRVMRSKGRVDRVLHLAAIARFSDADNDPKLAFETNVLGTKNVVSLCREYSIPLVYASTGSVYMPIDQEPPITEDFPAKGNSVYGCTKYMGELYVKEHTPHIILRYSHLYGREKRGHGLVGGFIQRIERGLAPTLYGGAQSNDFTYVKDIARANLIALKSSWDAWNHVYNIGTGEELTAKDAGEIICKAFDYRGKTEIRDQRTVDASRFVYDVSKAERMLGFKAEYTFEQGLKDMFQESK